MNRNFKTLATMALACLLLCGTALAAPRGGRGKGRPPKPAPRHHVEKHRPARRHHVKKRRPAPPPGYRRVRHHRRPPRIVRCCRYDHNVIDCLCCLPGQRIVLWH